MGSVHGIFSRFFSFQLRLRVKNHDRSSFDCLRPVVLVILGKFIGTLQSLFFWSSFFGCVVESQGAVAMGLFGNDDPQKGKKVNIFSTYNFNHPNSAENC